MGARQLKQVRRPDIPAAAVHPADQVQSIRFDMLRCRVHTLIGDVQEHDLPQHDLVVPHFHY